MRTVGLARALSKLGYCSRSQAQQLIGSGQVRVNGAVKRNPEAPVSLGRDRIEVNGASIHSAEKIYLMLNKPRGLVTTASDEKGRPTIYATLGNNLPWVAPVGRLDKASEGLLLLTNDSEWAAQVLAPESHLPKIYHVQVSGIRDAALADALTKGVRVSNGDFLRVKDATHIAAGQSQYLAGHHARRRKEPAHPTHAGATRVDVLRLVRVAIGPLTLGDLAKGASRRLTAAEKSNLDRAMQTLARG